MVRPQRCRHVRQTPDFNYFKPVGVEKKTLKEIILTIDEYEALKLKDYENLEEKKACEQMNISQPTFNRIYNNAKKKLVKTIIEGLAIKIEGGNYKMPNRDGTGPRGEGKMTGRGKGPCNKENDNNNNNDCQRPRKCCKRNKI